MHTYAHTATCSCLFIKVLAFIVYSHAAVVVIVIKIFMRWPKYQQCRKLVALVKPNKPLYTRCTYSHFDWAVFFQTHTHTNTPTHLPSWIAVHVSFRLVNCSPETLDWWKSFAGIWLIKLLPVLLKLGQLGIPDSSYQFIYSDFLLSSWFAAPSHTLCCGLINVAGFMHSEIF